MVNFKLSSLSAKKVKIVFFCIIPPGVKDAYVVLQSPRSFTGNHNQCSRPLSRQHFGRILSLRQPSGNRILPPKRNPVLPVHQRNWCRFHVGQRRFEAFFPLQGYTSSKCESKAYKIGNPWRAILQRSFLNPRFIIIWRITNELIFLTGQVVRENLWIQRQSIQLRDWHRQGLHPHHQGNVPILQVQAIGNQLALTVACSVSS